MKCCIGKPVHSGVDGQLDHRPVNSHPFQVDNKEVTRLGGRQSVPSCWISTPSQSEIKSTSNNCNCNSTFRTTTPSQSEILGFLPKRLYYQSQEDQETYYINSEGHLQCHQDPQNIIQAPTPQELPCQSSTLSFTNLAQSRSAVLRTFLGFTPNSFDRLGSLKGEYDIKVDPTVLPVQHVRRKVPIEGKTAFEWPLTIW